MYVFIKDVPRDNVILSAQREGSPQKGTTPVTRFFVASLLRMTTIARYFANALLLVILCQLIVLTAPALCQSQSWDYKAREKSQQASSAGLTALTKGYVDQAVTSLIEATNSDTSDPLPFHLLGLALAMKGRYDESLDALRKSYQLAPKVGETVLSIGCVHYLTHNYDKALNAWRKVLELNPKLCHVYGDMGMAYMREGDFGKASEGFRKLIACYPNSQFAYHGLATVKYLGGDFKGARQAADHAQSIAPYPPVVLLLAKLDYLQGDRSRASQRVQEYIKLTKKPWQQRSMTAIGYSLQHDFRWDPFLADNFDNAYLLQARALDLPQESSRQKSLSRQGKASVVIQNARTAQSGAPQDYFIRRELGLLLLADGQYSEAVEHFQEVLRLCPEAWVDVLHLGRAYALDGKAAEASAQVRRFQRKFADQRLSPAFIDIARVDPGLTAPPGGASETGSEIKSEAPGEIGF